MKTKERDTEVSICNRESGQPNKRLRVGCIRSCVPFHNGLLQEDILLRVGGTVYLHVNDTG